MVDESGLKRGSAAHTVTFYSTFSIPLTFYINLVEWPWCCGLLHQISADISVRYGHFLTRMDTHLRSVSFDRRLAMMLHWLSNAGSFQQLALLSGVGKCTAVDVVHCTIRAFKTHLVQSGGVLSPPFSYGLFARHLFFFGGYSEPVLSWVQVVDKSLSSTAPSNVSDS